MESNQPPTDGIGLRSNVSARFVLPHHAFGSQADLAASQPRDLFLPAAGKRLNAGQPGKAVAPHGVDEIGKVGTVGVG